MLQLDKTAVAESLFPVGNVFRQNVRVNVDFQHLSYLLILSVLSERGVKAVSLLKMRNK
jgi:hypothetical protein